MLLRLAYLGMTNAFAMLRMLPMSSREKDVEILALRHQIAVLERQLSGQRVRFDASDRALLAVLLQVLPREVLRRIRLLVQTDTVLRRHRDLIAGATPLPPGPNMEADRVPCTRSERWCYAWPGKTRTGGIAACTANYWSSE